MKEVSAVTNATKKTNKKSYRKYPLGLAIKMPFVALTENNLRKGEDEGPNSVDLEVKGKRG